ncbi:MAG TPA: calcium/proton exchanger [Pyrinomonadaceae bacterium]|jgi:Ca2+:H+ antiporter|nr:calcium/proton exchanger [Pyrinomonadaceae bacterium]
MNKSEKLIIASCAAASSSTAVLHFLEANPVIIFCVAAVSLALLAMVVGDGTEQLGKRFGPGLTGVLQSGLGNLPELFVCIFALRAGLDTVVQAALVGSILGNSILVLGIAFFLGGLKNGTQKFSSEPPRMIVTLLLLAVSVLIVPTLAKTLHTPAEGHILSLDIFLALVLLCLLASNIYFSIKGDAAITPKQPAEKEDVWPIKTTLGVLAAAGVGAALVSDWFVESLQPAMQSLGISQAFAGLVIMAIAGNAIENLIGIQLAWKNQMEYAVSIILNSSLQIALGLFPILVLLSYFLGGAILTFVLSPLLVAVLLLAVVVVAFIIYDGESIWPEGLALIGLYLIIASAFWWG